MIPSDSPRTRSASSLARGASLALLLAAPLAACKKGNAPKIPARASALPDSVDQVMYGLRLELTNSGVRRAQLLSDTAFFYEQSKRVGLRVVRTLFFNAQGAQDATMTAQRGMLDQVTQKVEGYGNVVVTSEDGRRLTSPHLVYDRTINQISSDSAFTFVAPGRNLSGVGFRSDPQLRNVQVLSNMRGSTIVPAGGLDARRR